MHTEPKTEYRDPLPFAGIRGVVKMGDLGQIIPGWIDEVEAWLKERGIKPSGPPLVRYHMCPTYPMAEAPLDICIGWPVAVPVKPAGRIVDETLPAGQYASLVYTGIDNGIAGNAALIFWALDNGLVWDSRPVENGESFAGRVEFMLDGPDDDPNPSNWRTEVMIKILG
jgi:effector-binding domain-containing protein